MNTHNGVPRIQSSHGSNTVDGVVRWDPAKSAWFSGMALVAILWGPITLQWDSFAIFLISSGMTLCLGHSLGMHRRLIHGSYACHPGLEYFLVYCGVLVGMAGPIGMVRTHDMRDWAQRQPRCHAYFSHGQDFWRDAWWQLHCELQLTHSPQFAPEARIANDRFYAWLERTWRWQQLPLALGLWLAGGWAWVVWGVCVRVCVSLTGHWLVGHFAHRQGHQTYVVDGAGVQGHNVGLGGLNGLLTMGECWHNNHHAFPGSACLGLEPGQPDPGWWVLRCLQRIGCVWDLRLPADLPNRPQVRRLQDTLSAKAIYER
ncbi:MAG: acyl-CoA desaturase [Burkholderiales bacterium PBB3]|nr:MAG: acyl-CoA desaturase [Burkholderiales bacterium PBB3]